MIKFYYWTTPNGHKIAIFLEEAELPYELIPINIGEGEQFDSQFLLLNPNHKIPVIVDDEPVGGGQALSLFESGAILVYMADKIKQFIGRDARERIKVIMWLFWQVGGLGPMAGQNHYFRAASETIPLAIDRYTKETARLYGVLNQQLDGRDYIADHYSIADMACFPWIVPYERQGQDLGEFPHLQRWFERMQERPAVQRAYALVEKLNPK